MLGQVKKGRSGYVSFVEFMPSKVGLGQVRPC
jgi:hypothetical protein